MSDREKDLQAEELADLARRLEAALEVETPDARREKALFVAGVGANARPRRWLGSLAPALAAVVLLVAIGIVSRTAQPGQALFPVREVLGNVGLAPSTTKEIRAHLDRAERLVVQAESSATTAPTRVEAIVHEIWAALDRADDLVGELDSDRRAPFEREIDALEERAEAAEDLADDTIDAREEAAEEADGDSSGSGSGGDDGSGRSGSGGGDDDSSGSGSGEDDDDSTGSEPGGDGDDSSGSGSGGDDDSRGSGSGGDDSSGSGSGSD